jgi:hypothetical protein
MSLLLPRTGLFRPNLPVFGPQRGSLAMQDTIGGFLPAYRINAWEANPDGHRCAWVGEFGKTFCGNPPSVGDANHGIACVGSQNRLPCGLLGG